MGYQGREQAFIKHQILKAYFERLIMIVGQARAETICYVDCFAGPWQEGMSDLEDTSIAISLQTIQQCQDKFAQLNWKAPKFRALFIEKDANSFARLSTFLAGKANIPIETCALQGEFIPFREEILKWCGRGNFAFFFIDPTGWKDVGMPKLRPLLLRPHSEFLINFMYNSVNFTLPQEKFSQARNIL